MKPILLFTFILFISSKALSQNLNTDLRFNYLFSGSHVTEVHSSTILKLLKFSPAQPSSELLSIFELPSFTSNLYVNNPHIQPLQMVNNQGMWCPQEPFNSQYFAHQIDYKTMNVGDLKMNASYVFDNMGNLRSTSTSFFRD